MHFKLELITAAAAWAVAASCASMPTIRSPLQGKCGSTVDKLGKKLSPAAKIYFPGSSEFEKATTRWSNLKKPTINVVVVPATENDVAETVKFANEKKQPFLAYNTAHGAITTLGRMDCGIEIWLNKLDDIKIAADGKTATFGGGTLSKKVTDTLWAAGKQTVTGTCECVSLMGPALGGGHGWLQGHYGLVADQFVSMNVVMADGTLKTIDSKSDLWWAMKGAGHNFGIVTSLTSKIYEANHRDWAIETVIFSGDKVEQVYDAANKHLLKGGKQPVDLINWSYWVNNPAADPNKPVILMFIIQEGVKAVDSAYTKPFHDIGPLSTTPIAGTYRDLAAWTQIALSSKPCQKEGLFNPRFPIYLDAYDVKAMKAAYDLFAKETETGSPFHDSLFMFEGYSMQGVRSVATPSTAYAHRDENLLVAPLISYKPAGADVDARAAKLGNDLRNIFHKASGRKAMRTYINYAFGNESPRDWYGSEQWRQDRLRALKAKYDPQGKFSFYGPIA